MEYPYIPTGIKGEMMRSGMDCHRKGQVLGTVGRIPVAIHSSGQTISRLAHIEGIALSAGEEVDEVAGGSLIKEIGFYCLLCELNSHFLLGENMISKSFRL